MPTYDIQTIINPTAGLFSTLTTELNSLYTAVANNENLIEVGYSDRQHVLYEKIVNDINQAIDIIKTDRRLLNKI